METLKLSTIVKAVTPELYGLLTEDELEADVFVQGGLFSIKKEDVGQLIASAIQQNHNKLYQ